MALLFLQSPAMVFAASINRCTCAGAYPLEELSEVIAAMKKLIRVRDVILKVNREYIRSAVQSDQYRTEPPFQLQGSYRNMNRIAEKVVPIMNDQELQTLILSNYENDAQTLTSNTESNLLKFKELMGILTGEESRRWASIKHTFPACARPSNVLLQRCRWNATWQVL
jgi:hypothetical protein